MTTDEELRTKLHRLIIENRSETGSIDQSDQLAMADEIMELFTAALHEAEVRGRIEELNKILEHAYYPHDTSYEFILAMNVRNRIATLTAEKEEKT
jgi:hypothetical protein